MCLGCWEDAGFPKVVTPQVLECADLAEEIGDYGSFHIVICDWNIEDSHIKFCLAQPDLSDDERRFGALMLSMPESERYAAMAVRDGYLSREGNILIDA